MVGPTEEARNIVRQLGSSSPPQHCPNTGEPSGHEVTLKLSSDLAQESHNPVEALLVLLELSYSPLHYINNSADFIVVL